MTNIKARGFESPAQLREHLDDLADEPPVEELSGEYSELAAQKEIAWLRKEVADLRERLSVVRDHANLVEIYPKQDVNPWLRIAVTLATTYILGRVVQHFRLRAPVPRPFR